MNTNNSKIAKNASEPSSSNTLNEASIDQIKSVGIVTASQTSMLLNMTNVIRSQTTVIWEVLEFWKFASV